MGKKQGFAIASLVLGLLFWIPLINIILGILAIIFGIIALNRINKNPQEYSGKGLAIAGIILGFLPIILFLIGLFKVFNGKMDLSSSKERFCESYGGECKLESEGCGETAIKNAFKCKELNKICCIS